MAGVAVISAEHPDLIAEANRRPPDEHLRTMATKVWHRSRFILTDGFCSLCCIQEEHPYPAALTSSVGHGEANVAEEHHRNAKNIWNIGKIKVKKTRTTPYHPQSNGLVKRANQTLLQLFRTYMVKDTDWEDHLPLMLYAYRTVKHASTGASPFKKVGLSDVASAMRNALLPEVDDTELSESPVDELNCMEGGDGKKQKKLHLLLVRKALVLCFAFLLCAGSTVLIINCCILSKETELFTHRTFDNSDDWRISLLPYHTDLSAQYAIVVTSCIMTVIVYCGFGGAYYINRTMTMISIISTLVVMFLFSALLIAEAVNKNSIMETTYRTVYTAFLENQYGTKWNFGVFDHIVDHIQQSNKCCGLRKSLNKSQITHPSYYTTLFWLESTNWGQIQQMKIGYDDMNHVPYVPVSCCINRSVKNCNFALFGDRAGIGKLFVPSTPYGFP
ncbi:hypothetical protein T11_10435 [Trichinella zimbabwensis]|uniref:Integrase catalytic domain-containing protein n=1 Tax=Trichinella zimbabwensis TaxID=268475 RepID=A0A0V1HGI1_9BILA|nr:hypothetical protein T11_10435 [Trichinella zimbabwensis]